MPRRKGPEAERAAARASEARWRYLLRHPIFRADLDETLATRARWPAPPLLDVEIHRQIFDLWRKWQVSGIPFRALRQTPELSAASLPVFEALFDPDAAGEPVAVIYDLDGETYLDARTLGDPRSLFLEIDLRYPRDVLLALIDERLRQTFDERRTILGDRIAGKRRRRLDKVDFQLRVYDLAEAGQTFTKIAEAVGQSPSTVKSAFLAARFNIFVKVPAEAGIPPSEQPSKRRTPMATLTDARSLSTHIARCPICKNAERPEDFCPQARAYAEQDQVPQRERPVGRDPAPLTKGKPSRRTR